MDFAFKPQATEASPGSLLLCLRDEDPREARQLAVVAVQQGREAFVGSGGDALELPSLSPTLDDMLAASILAWRHEGRDLPSQLRTFARYAGKIRAGLYSGTVPPNQSLAGLYLARLNRESDLDLSDSDCARRWIKRWTELAEAIFDAASRGADPFSGALFLDDHTFADEWAYLEQDARVFDDDVARGQRWQVTLPGGGQPRAGLFLPEPRSLLFKYWARQRDEVAVLVVKSESAWIASTDPVLRLSLAPLAQALQAAERAADAARAEADPWYDGSRHDYTLVAAPHGGSALGDDRVLEVIKATLSARAPQEEPGGRVAPGALLAAVLVLIGAVGGLALVGRGGQPEPVAQTVEVAHGGDVAHGGEADSGPISRGGVFAVEELERVRSTGMNAPSYALIVAVSGRPLSPLDHLSPCKAAGRDGRQLYRLLRDRFGYAAENMLLVTDSDEADPGLDSPPVYGRPTREVVSRAIEEIKAKAKRVDGHQNFLFYYAGHGVPERAEQEFGYLVLEGFRHQGRPADLTGYDMSQLVEDIDKHLQAISHKLVLVDCCFSGLASASARGGPKIEAGKVYELWDDDALLVITATTESQRAWERRKRSDFASALFKGLGEDGHSPLADGVGAADKDGIVTDEELYEYIRSELSAIDSRDRGGADQAPLHFRLHRQDVGQFLLFPVE